MFKTNVMWIRVRDGMVVEFPMEEEKQVILQIKTKHDPDGPHPKWNHQQIYSREVKKKNELANEKVKHKVQNKS